MALIMFRQRSVKPNVQQANTFLAKNSEWGGGGRGRVCQKLKEA